MDTDTAVDTIRTRVTPEDIYPFANRKCKMCWGKGFFVVRRAVVAKNEKGCTLSALGEREEALCSCGVKRFLKVTPNVDIDMSRKNAGAMYFVTQKPQEVESDVQQSAP